MAKFKIGDKVLRFQGGTNGGFNEGDTGVVVKGDYINVLMDKNGKTEDGNDEDNLKLISSKAVNMNLIEKAKLAFKGEPEKSFIKAGVMDSNENLTPEGQQLFLTYLLKTNGADFKKTVIDPILAEEETSKN